MTTTAPERAKVTGVLLQGNVRRVGWDKDDPESVNRARVAFENGLLTGMAAFETIKVETWYGARTQEVSTRNFNPEAEQIRMTAQFAGG